MSKKAPPHIPPPGFLVIFQLLTSKGYKVQQMCFSPTFQPKQPFPFCLLLFLENLFIKRANVKYKWCVTIWQQMFEKKLNKWLHKYCDFIERLVKGKVRCTYICVCIHMCIFLKFLWMTEIASGVSLRSCKSNWQNLIWKKTFLRPEDIFCVCEIYIH